MRLVLLRHLGSFGAMYRSSDGTVSEMTSVRNSVRDECALRMIAIEQTVRN